MTINLLAGTYAVTTPVVVPAFGIALEAYGPGTPLITLDASVPLQSIDVFQVNDVLAPGVNVPVASLPPSLFSGLHITNGNRGIRINPAPSATSGTPTMRIEIRDCEIDHNVIGVLVDADFLRNECVIEHNRIHDNHDYQPFGIGVHIVHVMPSSTLIRSNRIFSNEVNVQIENLTGDGDLSRDRVFSNFIDDAEWNVFLQNTATRLTNNTIAFCRSFGGGNPLGLVYGTFGTIPNRRLTLLNNIVWNPGFEDIRIQGAGAAPIFEVFQNDIEDVASPFVGTNGNFRLLPPFVGGVIPERLHLTPTATAPAIWSGARQDFVRALVDSSGGTAQLNVPFDPTMNLVMAGAPVRIDLPCDVDQDPRIVQMIGEAQLSPDIGADEIDFAALAALAGSGVDARGDILPDGNFAWTGTVSASSPAPVAAFLLMAFPPDPVNEHLFFLPFGSVQVGLNGLNLLSGFPTAGTNRIDFALNFGPVDFSLIEAEVHVQALVGDAGGSAFTRRMKLEANI
ncbi:MAG: right-handed parallel beta-helix repeat-containing protein [Planctomycetota bacterium]